MALSNSKNYTDTVTAATIIALALRRLGEIDHADTVDPTEEADALVVLNLMIKEWSKLGLDNWLRQTAAIWMVAPGSQSIYTLGPTGSRAAFAWWETTLTGGGSIGSTAVTITEADSTHCVTGSYVGVRQDDGTILFGTGTFAGTTITLSTALTATASTGNRVYIYGTAYQISRPVRLLYASRATIDVTNVSADSDSLVENEAEVRIIGMDEYSSMAIKRQSGPPVSVYYEPTLFNGTLKVWPTGVVGIDYDKIYLTYNIYTDDLDVTTNNAQFPPEWINTIAWNLASQLAPEYGIALREQQSIQGRAMIHLNDMLDYDVENASAIFERNYQPGVRP